MACTLTQREDGTLGLDLWFLSTAAVSRSITLETPPTQVVLLTSTSPHFGGARVWFSCPFVANDTACLRRCRILYLPFGARSFGCRICHRLSYQSRQEHRGFFFERYTRPLRLLAKATQRGRSKQHVLLVSLLPEVREAQRDFHPRLRKARSQPVGGHA